MNILNFIVPPSPKKEKALYRWELFTLIGSVILFSIFILCFLYHLFLFLQARSKYLQIQKKIHQNEEHVHKLNKAQKLHEELIRQQEKIQKFQNFKHAIRYLEEISRIIPDSVALQTFKQERKKQLTMEGKAQSMKDITNFMRALHNSALFENIQLTSISQHQENRENQKSEIYFTLKGKYKK